MRLFLETLLFVATGRVSLESSNDYFKNSEAWKCAELFCLLLQSSSQANKIAAILTQHSELKIHVIGHTDNVPIRAGARSRFSSNWELSAARALAAMRFLTEDAGVDPRRLGAVGYGEFRPVADNSTAEGRARNRRIAVTILADDLAGADTSPIDRTSTTAPMLEEVRLKEPKD